MASPGGPLGPHPKGYRCLTLLAVPPVSEGGLPWKRGHCGAGSHRWLSSWLSSVPCVTSCISLTYSAAGGQWVFPVRGYCKEGVLEHAGTCRFCEPEHVFPWAPLEVELRLEWSQLSLRLLWGPVDTPRNATICSCFQRVHTLGLLDSRPGLGPLQPGVCLFLAGLGLGLGSPGARLSSTPSGGQRPCALHPAGTPRGGVPSRRPTPTLPSSGKPVV